MNKGVIAAALAAALAAGGGYWAGRESAPPPAAASSAAGAAKPAQQARRILYYRNPMGLPDTSPTPKKDPMGMDYIPVYADDQDQEPAAANQVSISPEKIQKLGVRTEAASLHDLGRIIRAAGRVEADERRTYAIAPKFEGYIERLHVNATGQAVGKGQPLFEVYSPELVSAQREYAIAVQGIESLKDAEGSGQEGMRQLAEASLARLRNWDIPEAQIQALARTGQARRTLSLRSPVNGIVTGKTAVQGMRFMAGETLYQIADLASVWVIADVFEQDIGQVRPGARARIKINAYPDQRFEGSISYVYPTLNAATRTVPVRIELANPGRLLKPGMYAQIELPAAATGAVLSVPNSAVIDSGTHQIALVEVKDGRFEPRTLRLGARGDERVEVLAGVREGERVVVAANFLIDAESNLQAAIGGFAHAAGAAASPAAQPAAARIGHHAQGKVEEVDAAAGTVSIAHGPVPSLNWPQMSMEFKPANAAILKQLKPGAAVDFEFVERGEGEWVITAVTPAGAAAGKAGPHAGH